MQPYFLSTTYATFVTFLIIFTGLLGSIYSSDIKNTIETYIPMVFSSGSPVSVFVVCFVLTSTLFFFGRNAVERQRATTEDELREKTLSLAESLTRVDRETRRLGELLNSIPTLPVSEFLEKYSLFLVTAEDMITQRQNGDRLSAQNDIRAILGMISQLSKEYSKVDSRHSANIMVYRGVQSYSSSDIEKVRLQEQLQFAEDNVDITHMVGLLELVADLSTSSEDFVDVDAERRFVSDATLKPLCLGIPKSHRTRDGKFKVLLGAQLAFCERSHSFVSDTEQLTEWMKKHGDFTKRVERSVANYFHDHRDIRSFVSFPIYSESWYRSAGSSEAEMLGILNIHTHTEELASSADPRFVNLINPLVEKLSQLLPQAMRKEDES